MPVVVVASFTAKPESVDTVRAACEKAIADVHDEPGCELYSLHRTGDTFVFIEQWAARMAAAGAGEILLTSMDRDGTKAGFDLDLLRAVRAAVPVPIVASGGVGTVDHFVEGARAGATGLLAASVFHYGQFRVVDAKAALAAAGLPVRPIPAALAA